MGSNRYPKVRERGPGVPFTADNVALAAGLTGREVLYDLYAGAGSMGLVLAPKASEVIAVEIVEAPVARALDPVAAKTMDDEGVPWDGNSHVRLEDRESGERWTLTAKQAHELALALMAAARDVNRAGGR